MFNWKIDKIKINHKIKLKLINKDFKKIIKWTKTIKMIKIKVLILTVIISNRLL